MPEEVHAGTGDVGALPLNGRRRRCAYGIGEHQRRAGKNARFWRGQRRRIAAAHPGISRARATRRMVWGECGRPWWPMVAEARVELAVPAGSFTMGRLPRGLNVNEPHGFLLFQMTIASLDAAPYALLLGRQSLTSRLQSGALWRQYRWAAEHSKDL